MRWSDSAFGFPRYLAKEVQSSNECLRRQEMCSISDIERELELVRHQIEIEKAVYQATAEYLQGKKTKLQEECSAWAQKSDEDIQAKEKEIQVWFINPRFPPTLCKQLGGSLFRQFSGGRDTTPVWKPGPEKHQSSWYIAFLYWWSTIRHLTDMRRQCMTPVT